ncbi:hypothetical protein LMTR13_05640 [Bradyrhizobium icense]|uniref:Uncharacterized protein n=1 Tax=Bradyrhizobium icense TaxID=1274631 RepID=A0A1B1UAP7_9BRAD|nr:hypothetical protein LMTR13_05640 [Bradyrhizobium icense]
MVRACRPPARPGEFPVRAPLDNGDVDISQRQLAGQHQPCRTSSGDHHCMLGHRHTPVVSAAAINPALRDRQVDGNSFVGPAEAAGRYQIIEQKQASQARAGVRRLAC